MSSYPSYTIQHHPSSYILTIHEKFIAKEAMSAIEFKSNKPRYHLRDNSRRSFGGPMCNILGMSIPGTWQRHLPLKRMWMCSDVLGCSDVLNKVLRYSKIHDQEMNRLNMIE